MNISLSWVVGSVFFLEMMVLFRGKSERLITAQRGGDKVQKQSRDHDIVGDALEKAKIGLARAGFEP
jgi:hypothetical protein